MTAGLGIDTFHIAHRASSVTAIDIDPDVAEALACNAEALGLPNVESVCTDSVQYLHDTQRRFDTIFIDPARRGQGGKRLFALADCNPDVTALLPMLADRCHKLIIKASPMLDICHTLEEIPCATHLYVTGTRHECKELVIVCDFNAPAPSTPAVTALTIDGETSATFTFTYAEEHTTEPSIAEPKAGQILYEPYPALLKSGAFRLLCPRFGCTKPHQNSHLYMADRPVADFPGTPYIIDDVIPFSSSEIRRIRERITSASIATRNFILSADELRRKLKLKEDPRRRIIGTTTQSGRILITTSPLSEPN